MEASPLALVVDGDAESRQMYAEFLRHSAFEVVEAEDGRVALAKALSRQPAVIIMETRLAGIDGFVLCRMLRDDATTERVPIVMVTADAFPSAIERAEAAGADTVLTKPCAPPDVASEVRRLLATSAELRQRARRIRSRVDAEVARSGDLLARSQAEARRRPLVRSLEQCDTTSPPLAPLPLRCPTCDLPLTYVVSHVGGVSIKSPEQWDDFECAAGCGTFEYRHRTRKMRRLS